MRVLYPDNFNFVESGWKIYKSVLYYLILVRLDSLQSLLFTSLK